MGLVHVGRVTNIYTIDGADRIESLEVVCGQAGKWRGTAQKGQFDVGDLCVVFLQDAQLPQLPEYAFMERYHWRVSMKRFKGVPSEVLVMPLVLDATKYGVVGMDITEAMGVTKYEKPLPLGMSGETLGWFPSFIPKTDEPNFQAAPEMVQWMRGKQFYSTVKADGSSATVYKYQGHFGCCSRKLELKDTPNNAIWQIARQYHIESALIDGFAMQFEMVGLGIQSNPMGLKKIEPRLFNVYDIDSHRYLNGSSVIEYSKEIGMPVVDIVDWNMTFGFEDDESLRHYAEGLYPNGHQREGVVIRPMEEARMSTGERISFKVLNLSYKG